MIDVVTINIGVVLTKVKLKSVKSIVFFNYIKGNNDIVKENYKIQ